MLQLDKALRILYKQYLRIAGLYNKNENDEKKRRWT